MNTVSFKVLKEHHNIKVGEIITFDERGERAYTKSNEQWFIWPAYLMRLLPGYFIEIDLEGTRFNDWLEYTGSFRFPKEGEIFAINKDKWKRSIWNHAVHRAHILRPILEYKPEGEKFNDNWEYAGKVERYKEGRAYVSSEEAKTVFVASKYTRQDEVGQLLRPIKKSPTIDELIKATKSSLEHWLKDILPLVIKGQTKELPANAKDCPLCCLFYSHYSKLQNSCSYCPLQSCGSGSVYLQFTSDRTFDNALVIIKRLYECKRELESKKKRNG